MNQTDGQAAFVRRHVGPSADDTAAMLDELGFDTIDEFVAAVVPAAVADSRLRLPQPSTESEVLADLRGLADRNQVSVAMIGMGYYGTITPAVIRRRVLENPAWYTAYTPYQPEISQGRLEALLNFQTMVADLTGLPNVVRRLRQFAAEPGADPSWQPAPLLVKLALEGKTFN